MSTPLFRNLLILGVFLLTSLGSCTLEASSLDSSLSQIEIRVMPEAVVYNKNYQLGDIAELDGFDIDLVEKLSHLKIGRSPMPGKSLRISSAQIKSHLRGLIHPKQLHLIVPKNPIVSRASLKLEKQQLREIVIRQIKKNYQEYDQVNVTVQSRLRDQYLPKGELSYQLTRIGGARNVGGSSSWALKLQIDHKTYKKLIIRAKIEVIDQVVVAKGVIPKGTTIGNEDLKTVSKDISNEPRYYAHDLSSVVGQQARRDIHNNETLQAHLLQDPIILEKGQPVMLVYETDTIFVSNKAIALRDGKKGEIIPVRILGNRKTIYGLVVSSKRVEVAL